jgi:hypothetical protein
VHFSKTIAERAEKQRRFSHARVDLPRVTNVEAEPGLRQPIEDLP